MKDVGPSRSVGQGPMKSLSSVCLSVHQSMCLSVTYFSNKIESLVFSDSLHDDS